MPTESWGEFEHQIDSKGRLFVPRRLSDMFTAGGQLIRAWNGKCLVYFPAEHWQQFQQRWQERLARVLAEQHDLASYFRAEMVADDVGRCLSSGAAITVDNQGRITVPAGLREWARLLTDVVLIARGDRVELWDKRTWLVHQETKLTPDALAEAMTGLTAPQAAE